MGKGITSYFQGDHFLLPVHRRYRLFDLLVLVLGVQLLDYLVIVDFCFFFRVIDVSLRPPLFAAEVKVKTNCGFGSILMVIRVAMVHESLNNF